MDLPVMPPVAPMLAKPVHGIPAGDYVFEPKWDGFRSIVFRDGDEVEIGSRNERPMTRYFPELVDAALAELPPRCVIDGEIVLPDFAAGRLDFEALQLRLHPAASRVRLLAAQTPAHFVAFDLLALGSDDYTERPFAERRAALETALSAARPPIHLTPATTDPAVAGQWFTQFEGAGLDGLIAKSPAGLYEPDKRVMFKIKHERTADCVVAGYRPHKTGDDAIGSLLLGLYRPTGELASVGVIGAFPMAVRRELRAELEPLVTTFEGHPWNWGPRRRRRHGRAHAAQLRVQPVERGQGPVVRPAAPRARRRGPLRPHGRDTFPAHGAVRPLAPGPLAFLVHVRATGGARQLQPVGNPGERQRSAILSDSGGLCRTERP